ncbi:MAG: ROK family protein [Acidobacteria bacterium]|nr:ROK family protein [Acidobacteriota bacterium]
MTEDARILAVDWGATSVKSALVDADGRALSPLKRRRTPHPCPPDTFFDVVRARVEATGARRVGVGFPGEMREGLVVGTGNLAREGGPGTPLIPELVERWRGRDLSCELSELTGADVRVINDAALAALGCGGGYGVELIVTLGTGCGLALMDGGELQPTPDVGTHPSHDGRSFDVALGERARSRDESRWREDVRRALIQWRVAFGVERVYLAGGNGPRLQDRDETWPPGIVIVGNQAALRGAARLFGARTPSTGVG